MNFAKTTYLEQKLLNHVLLGENYTPPATVYIALFTTDPGKQGDTSGEVADPTYERQPVEFSSATMDSVSGSICHNVYDIEFAQATENWGTVTHAGIMDAQTGGNVLYRAPLTDVNGNPNPKTVSKDDFFKFPAEQIVVGED